MSDTERAMTKADAAELLGVSEGATAEDVRRRYQELHNEYQVRLANAPTPALTRTYQKNLQELQTAAEVLAPGAAASAPDFPAAEPVAGGPFAVSRPAAETPRPRARPEAADDAGWPRSTVVAASVAVVCLAALSLFVLLWAKQRATALAAGSHMMLAAERIADLERRAGTWEQALKPQLLDVCNRSAKTLRIESVVSIYPDNLGKLRTIHSGSYGYPTWDIGPGERKRLSILRGTSDDWDGVSAFYALQVVYPGAEPFLVAGLLSEAKDNCANLYLD